MANCNHSSAHKEGIPNPNQIRQYSTYERTNQVSRQSSRREDAKGPSRPHAAFGSQLKAWTKTHIPDDPCNKSQEYELIDIVYEPDEGHDDSNANGGAHEHRFTTALSPKVTPKRCSEPCS
jgi:hypothetical protein